MAMAPCGLWMIPLMVAKKSDSRVFRPHQESWSSMP